MVSKAHVQYIFTNTQQTKVTLKKEMQLQGKMITQNETKH